MASRQDEWLSRRARPDEVKTVTFPAWKNPGLPESGTVTFKTGECPCSICGHRYQYECEDADCKCCTSVCN